MGYHDDDLPGPGKILFLCLVAFIFLGLLGWATDWFGLVAERPMQKYQEETRAQTYDTSRQYEQGTNRDIARYCEQMRTAQEAGAKKAVAALIRTTISSYNGVIYDDNKDCVSEAKGY